MGIGGLFVIFGNISLGFLMSSLQYSDRCESALKGIMNLSTEIASNKMEYQRIFEIISKQDENNQIHYTDKGVETIRVRNLNFSYNSRH